MAAVTREEFISCSHHPPTWFKQPWLLPKTDSKKEDTGQSPTCGKLHINFLLPLGFSAGKIQISYSNWCFTFSWKKWVQGCFEWGNLLGEFTLSAKTHQEKKWVSPQPPPTPRPVLCTQHFKEVCCHISTISLCTQSHCHLSSWRDSADTGGNQLCTYEAGMGPRAHRKTPCTEMGLQQSSALPSAPSTALISQNKSPQRTSVSPYSFSLNYWALLSLSGIQVSSQSQNNL